MARRVMLGTAGAVLATALGLAFGVAASPVVAAEPTVAPIATRLLVTVPPDVTIGDSVTIKARLTTADGSAIPGARLSLAIGSVEVRATRTDVDGLASLSIPSEKLRGAATLGLSVSFAGTRTYASSTVNSALVIQPAAITISTVPAVEGLQMALGDLEAMTDAAGLATFQVAQLGQQEFVPNLDVPLADVEVSFFRWEDGVFSARRSIDVKGSHVYVLGLRSAVRTTIRFVDQAGHEVDPALVTSVTLISYSGLERTLTTFDNVWLDAAFPARRVEGLFKVTNTHRVSEVIISGTNVVNRGQQTWLPVPGGILEIEVLLYDMRLHAVDAFFGWPIVTDVTLDYPDGSHAVGRTGADGSIVFRSLPRGDYTIRLRSSGIVPPSPIALSRPQDARIRVISRLDIAVSGGAALMAVLAIVFLGRRHQVNHAAGLARRFVGGYAERVEIAARRLDPQARMALDAVRRRVPSRRYEFVLPLAILRPPAHFLRVATTIPDLSSLPDLRSLRVPRLSDAWRLRLAFTALAVVGLGLVAAIASAVGLSPSAANPSLTLVPTASPSLSLRPSSTGGSQSVQVVQSLITANGYLAADVISLDNALAARPVGTADLVAILGKVTLHARIAGENIERAGHLLGDSPIVGELAALYLQVETKATAALATTMNDAAAYERNARSIAALLRDFEPLDTELRALVAATPLKVTGPNASPP